MKIMKKLKDTMLNVGVAIMAIPGKIFADSQTYIITETGMLYGPENGNTLKSGRILGILQARIIPLVLIIGLIAYWKKSERDKKDKIIMSIKMVGVAVFAIFIIAIIKIIRNIAMSR